MLNTIFFDLDGTLARSCRTISSAPISARW